MALLPGLLDAPIRNSSIAKHIEALNSCALRLPVVRCPPKPSWLLGWELAQVLQVDGPGELGRVARSTVAGHLSSLAALGMHGGMSEKELKALRLLAHSMQNKIEMKEKRKTARLHALIERGGYEEAIRTVVRLLDEAEAARDWTAAAEQARATAAILMLAINIPPRTGDMSLWR
jgi:hypothetical protein